MDIRVDAGMRRHGIGRIDRSAQRHPWLLRSIRTEPRNLLLGYFETSSTLTKSRPIAPPRSEDAVDAGADHLQEGVLGPFQVAGSWKGSANA